MSEERELNRLVMKATLFDWIQEQLDLPEAMEFYEQTVKNNIKKSRENYLIEKKATSRFAAAMGWDEKEHPRGPDGRFRRKNASSLTREGQPGRESVEAYEASAEALRSFAQVRQQMTPQTAARAENLAAAADRLAAVQAVASNVADRDSENPASHIGTRLLNTMFLLRPPKSSGDDATDMLYLQSFDALEKALNATGEAYDKVLRPKMKTARKEMSGRPLATERLGHEGFEPGIGKRAREELLMEYLMNDVNDINIREMDAGEVRPKKLGDKTLRWNPDKEGPDKFEVVTDNYELAGGQRSMSGFVFDNDGKLQASYIAKHPDHDKWPFSPRALNKAEGSHVVRGRRRAGFDHADVRWGLVSGTRSVTTVAPEGAMRIQFSEKIRNEPKTAMKFYRTYRSARKQLKNEERVHRVQVRDTSGPAWQSPRYTSKDESLKMFTDTEATRIALDVARQQHPNLVNVEFIPLMRDPATPNNRKRLEDKAKGGSFMARRELDRQQRNNVPPGQAFGGNRAIDTDSHLRALGVGNLSDEEVEALDSIASGQKIPLDRTAPGSVARAAAVASQQGVRSEVIAQVMANQVERDALFDGYAFMAESGPNSPGFLAASPASDRNDDTRAEAVANLTRRTGLQGQQKRNAQAMFTEQQIRQEAERVHNKKLAQSQRARSNPNVGLSSTGNVAETQRQLRNQGYMTPAERRRLKEQGIVKGFRRMKNKKKVEDVIRRLERRNNLPRIEKHFLGTHSDHKHHSRSEHREIRGNIREGKRVVRLTTRGRPTDDLTAATAPAASRAWAVQRDANRAYKKKQINRDQRNTQLKTAARRFESELRSDPAVRAAARSRLERDKIGKHLAGKHDQADHKRGKNHKKSQQFVAGMALSGLAGGAISGAAEKHSLNDQAKHQERMARLDKDQWKRDEFRDRLVATDRNRLSGHHRRMATITRDSDKQKYHLAMSDREKFSERMATSNADHARRMGETAEGVRLKNASNLRRMGRKAYRGHTVTGLATGLGVGLAIDRLENKKMKRKKS